MQEVKAVFCQFASSLKEVILHFSIYMIFLLASAKSVILHLSGEGISLMICPQGRCPKKKRGFLGIFPKGRPPPPLPPFWEPLFPKKKCGLFCVLGPQEHFWSSSKCSLFGNYSDIYFWEQVTPPPSQRKKFPKLLVFADFFQNFPDFESRVM